MEGVAVTGYRVTASDGLSTCETTGVTSCVVPGLTNGQPYTFIVTALTTYGEGPASAPSGAVAPVGPATPPSPTAAPTLGPVITGEPRFGNPLAVAPGTWPGVTSLSYAWNRSGTPIPGATTAGYTPVAADVGHLLTVTVSGSGPGLTPGTATTPARVVAKAAPTLREPAATTKKRAKGVRQGRSIVLTFDVGPWADGGKVTAVLAGKRRGTATVAAGSVVIRVSTKRISTGRRPLVLRYSGTAVALPVDRTVRLRVRPAR